MGKSKKPRKKVRKRSGAKSQKEFLLETTSIDEINKLKKFGEYYINFHWAYYTNLSYQRSRITNEIKKSLLEAAIPNFEFSKWKRIIRLKHNCKPLSVGGSIKSLGGRFNIGDINSPIISSFPALYAAVDFETAIKEALGQDEKSDEDQMYVHALANKTSFTSISLKGQLDYIIDLNKPERLQPFIDLIKGFSVTDYLKTAAAAINQKIDLIKTVPALINALMLSNWRDWPMLFDVPAASQIFGELVTNAGIEGILYPSKFTKKDCLAIFPQNFNPGDSYIELEDEPSSGVKVKRIDADIWSKYQTELQGF